METRLLFVIMMHLAEIEQMPYLPLQMCASLKTKKSQFHRNCGMQTYVPVMPGFVEGAEGSLRRTTLVSGEDGCWVADRSFLSGASTSGECLLRSTVSLLERFGVRFDVLERAGGPVSVSA
jgi:hypothetical protein